MKEDLNKKSGKALAWSSITEIMAKLITPIINIVLARLLAPEAFGAVATITMIISFAEIFADAGFQKYIVQHEFQNNDELNNSTNVAFLTNLSISVLLVASIVIFRNPLARLVGSDDLGNAIAVASLSIILVAFSSIQMARFKRDLDFKSLFFVRIGSSIIPLIVTVPLAFVMRNFWALVIGTLAVNLFNAIILTLKSKWKPKLYYDFSLFKDMFSFSAWTLLESIVIWLTINIDIFIVGNKLNDYYLGVYKTSMQTVNSYMGLISSAVIPVLFSTLSKYQNDEKSFNDTFFKFQKISSLLVFPMAIGIYIYRDLVTLLLLGSQWSEAANFIGIWGLMSALTIVFSNFASEVYRSRANPKLSTISQILHIAFLVPTVCVSINYSFSILYISRSLTRLQFIFTSIIFLRIFYRIRINKMMTNIFPALFSSLVMGIVGFLLSNVNSNILWQFATIFICILTYAFVLLVFFPKTRNEILAIRYLKNKKTGTSNE